MNEAEKRDMTFPLVLNIFVFFLLHEIFNFNAWWLWLVWPLNIWAIVYSIKRGQWK